MAFHYTITIDQQTIINKGWDMPVNLPNGKTAKATITTWALLDWLQFFANLTNKDGVKIVKDDEGFIWINYGYVINSNPLLELNKRNLKQHLDILEQLGLIVLRKHDGSVYFKFGKEFEKGADDDLPKPTKRMLKNKALNASKTQKSVSANADNQTAEMPLNASKTLKKYSSYASYGVFVPPKVNLLVKSRVYPNLDYKKAFWDTLCANCVEDLPFTRFYIQGNEDDEVRDYLNEVARQKRAFLQNKLTTAQFYKKCAKIA